MGGQCSVAQRPPWYASFFLDPGVKWCKLKMGNFAYVHAVPWIAISMLLIRSLLETWIATPIGLSFNVSERTVRQPENNRVLAEAYSANRVPGEETVHRLAREVGWTPYRVHRWFWKARQYKKPSQITKFNESCWRFVVYTCTSIVGLCCLAKEEFFWNRSKCYEDYPANAPSDSVMKYWACQLAFYLSLLVTHHRDIRRNDYLLMLCHHVMTVLLLSMSFVMNGVQIGILIVLTHDISDIPLELGKLFKYIKYEKAALVTFNIFGVMFFVTRMVIYPLFLLRSVVFEFPVILCRSPAWWIIFSMLLLLQMMHVYWFYLILQMLSSFLTTNQMKDDIRSESEYSSYIYDDQSTTTTTGISTVTSQSTGYSTKSKVY